MESYILISTINDFIFCPRSIYYHNLYGNKNQHLYHEAEQIDGKMKHESISEGTYSNEKKYLFDFYVYSEKYGILGKIDIYDKESKKLIERKNKIVEVYDGYKYQVYAQYFCLIEMGYEVESIYLHSLKTNKRFKIEIPNEIEIKKFEDILLQMKQYSLGKPFSQNINKCNKCVYNPLCDIID